MQLINKNILIIFLFINSVLTDIIKQQQNKQNKQKVPWVQKIIWTYWTQKIADDDHIKKIFEFNHKSQQSGWQLRHVNNQNLYYWLNQIPDFGDKLEYPQFKNYKPHVRANLIRLALIKHFGGVYIDFTTILTSSFDWLLNIQNQKQVSQRFGKQPNLLLLYSYHTEKQTYYDEELHKNVLIYPSFQNFFIASKKGEGFIQDWYNFYVEAKNISQKKYPEGQNTEKSWIVQTAKQQKIKIGGFGGKYFQVAICGQIVLQRKQRELDKNWETNKRKGPRRLAVKQYNIWSMDTKQIAYQIQNLVNFGFLQFVYVLMQSDKDYLKEKGIAGRHFIKLFNQNTNQLKRFFQNQTTTRQIICPQSLSILENSFGYQYLLKDYPIKFYSNKVVNISFNRHCIKYQYMKLLKNPEKIVLNENEKLIKKQSPDNQLKILSKYKKLQESVEQINQKVSNQLQALSSKINSLNNQGLVFAKQGYDENNKQRKKKILQNQKTNEKTDHNIVDKLNLIRQKKSNLFDQLTNYFLQKQKQQQLWKYLLEYFAILASHVIIISGFLFIQQKLNNMIVKAQNKQLISQIKQTEQQI